MNAHLLSHVCFFVSPWTVAHQDPLSKNTGAGCHFLFQGDLLTQGSKPCLLHLLHWQADSLPLHHSGKPKCIVIKSFFMTQSESIHPHLICHGTSYTFITILSTPFKSSLYLLVFPMRLRAITVFIIFPQCLARCRHSISSNKPWEPLYSAYRKTVSTQQLWVNKVRWHSFSSYLLTKDLADL